MNTTACTLALLFVVGLPFPSAAQMEKASSVEVVVDPRVELLAVVEYLSGYTAVPGLLTSYDFHYKSDVEAAFSRFRSHPAVTLFDKMSHQGFAFEAPVAAVLHHGPLPTLEELTKIDEAVVERAGSVRTLKEFFSALRSFARDAAFEDFLAKHRGFYDSIVADSRRKLTGIDVGMLERYFGETRRSYTIVLSPLLHHGGFGVRVRMADGGTEVYSIVGSHGVSDGRPTFGTAEDFRYLVWHEFGHSFVNPLVDLFGERVDRTDALFPALREQMRQQGYDDWRSVVYEHLVRASTVRFAFRELGEVAGKKALQDEISRGFLYVHALCTKLEQYEESRERYTSLADFFPKLLDVFETAAIDAEKDPATGKPRVIGTLPRNEDREVDPDLSEILVHFDRDMEPDSFGWIQLEVTAFPELTSEPKFLSARTAALPVKLERGRFYRIGLNTGGIKGFRGRNGRWAESYKIEFKTKP